MPENIRAKLLLHEKVEVRSSEDGFQGSWHTGKVISCQDLSLTVLYDHLLTDDGSRNLTETVNVSPVVETGLSTNYRGFIRPSPPVCDVEQEHLHYGHCVDVFTVDAWWEGVVFDHDDGSSQRRIFFPDIGDEMEARIDMLRFSKDWNEVTQEWKVRGSWFFLELIEEVGQDWPLPVSVKQIWYEVRMKKNFANLCDWTSTLSDIWRELVFQVFSENLKVTVKHLSMELDLSLKLAGVGHSLLELSDQTIDIVLKNQGFFNTSLVEATSQLDSEGIIPADLNDKCHQQNNQVPSPVLTCEESLPVDNSALPVFSLNLDDDSEVGTQNLYGTPRISVMANIGKKSVSRRKKRWKSAVPSLISGAEFCPGAIDECVKMYILDKKPPISAILSARKHLLYLDWKIEFVTEKVGFERLRYSSPSEGELFYSLRQVCMKIVPVSCPEEIPSPQSSIGFSKCSNPSDVLVVEPEHCPEALIDYCFFQEHKDSFQDKKSMQKLKCLKAKKHLSAIGWSFFYHPKGERRELRYVSPSGTMFNSLLSACRRCIEGPAVAKGTNGNACVIEGKLCKARMLRKRRKHDEPFCIEDSILRKRGRKPRMSMMARGDMDAFSSNFVGRVSKRVREVITSSHQTPRTIMSLLIDNNVVLPRSKVQYRRRKNGSPMKEGRIVREGIKCNCCGDIFSLSKFELHAGSNYHKPSEYIFLEDGRSLLECQLQLKEQKGSRSLRSKSKEMKGSEQKEDNDYMCSVCRYGGELILCDQCPSSFHMQCLDLKEVPDGDWFCPSCRCRICGLCRFCNKNGHGTDSSVLICGQCQQRYHAECLMNKGIVNIECNPEGHWFCQDACEQIFCGLHKLLGKQIHVGTENLTWTLTKCIKSDSHESDASSDEHLMENYSKLNVALSVMHECFEPVIEPSTGRDVVEDVIFSRWSHLNRLNFQGFYTVLLEKNEELISVATVRIYGKRVAEIPLVATRLHFRRLGMCRVLMKELEKKLGELGVKTLVLPAVPSVLSTWTNCFGFRVMNESERLNFADHTFLGFQDTVFCHKDLTTIPTPSTATGTLAISYDDVNVDNSAISQVNILEQCVVEHAENKNSDSSSITIPVLAFSSNAF